MSEKTVTPEVAGSFDAEALAEAFYRTADRLSAQRPLTERDIQKAEDQIAADRRRLVRTWMCELMVVVVALAALVAVLVVGF